MISTFSFIDSAISPIYIRLEVLRAKNAKHRKPISRDPTFSDLFLRASPSPLDQTSFAPAHTMRPSMRLPLREAKYVCSSCRVGATPRISPLNQQFLRNASDSPGLLERTRRKLWGTDKPPGPADPYSGSQLMPQEEPAAETTGLSPGKGEEETPFPDDMDLESLDWNNMPRVGYTKDKEWIINGATKADKIKPYV